MVEGFTCPRPATGDLLELGVSPEEPRQRAELSIEEKLAQVRRLRESAMEKVEAVARTRPAYNPPSERIAEFSNRVQAEGSSSDRFGQVGRVKDPGNSVTCLRAKPPTSDILDHADALVRRCGWLGA